MSWRLWRIDKVSHLPSLSGAASLIQVTAVQRSPFLVYGIRPILHLRGYILWQCTNDRMRAMN